MVNIVFVQADGAEQEVDVEEDTTLMEAATLNLVPGVEGMCGGICSCATCHCYIDEAWQEKLHDPSMGEQLMLNTAKERTDLSRLGCQILVTWEMEGMRIRLPSEQGSVA
ncbi:MAG: 2Fe-2S iron-sulfur cluster-binding protein [Pseudomonadales bacterium]